MHQNSRTVFDNKQIEFSPGAFYFDPSWDDFYPDTGEIHPPRAPELWKPVVKLISYINADHAGNADICHSHSYMNITFY